jgi:hypothetical protein
MFDDVLKRWVVTYSDFVTGEPIDPRDLDLTLLECCCNEGGSGNPNIANLPSYTSREAAQADAALKVGDLWKASVDNIMGYVAGSVFQKI